MGNEHGEWIMCGLEENDPRRIRTAEELIGYVNEVGFLPLFKNGVPGFSAEEHCAARYWWSGDEVNDPWEWRKELARSGKVAYGKFFDKKAGYISLEWLPAFLNYRRDGYDFDARWDDEKADRRSKKIMDCFENRSEIFSYELKELAGFGKGGEKNFDGAVTALQMQTYLTVRDFRYRLNKQGLPYGWGIAVYATPEAVWGDEPISAAYTEEPETSFVRIMEHLRELYPKAEEKVLKKLLK